MEEKDIISYCDSHTVTRIFNQSKSGFGFGLNALNLKQHGHSRCMHYIFMWSGKSGIGIAIP